ncbi:MAG: hypothetical protein ACKOUM_01225, partial [Sphingopyxis sp.]
MARVSPAQNPFPAHVGRIVATFSAVVALSAFLPHRERELIAGAQRPATGFVAQSVADATFAAPFAATGGVLGGAVGGGGLVTASALRALALPRLAPRAALAGPGATAPLVAPAAAAAQGSPLVMPLGNAASALPSAATPAALLADSGGTGAESSALNDLPGGLGQGGSIAGPTAATTSTSSGTTTS